MLLSCCGRGGGGGDRVGPHAPHAAVPSPARAHAPESQVSVPPAAAAAAAAAVAPAPEAADVHRAFLKALKAGDTAKVCELLDAGADLERVGMWGNTPLIVATHYGHAAVALELLRRGASTSVVNELGCTALLFSCNERMDDVVAALLDDPATPLRPAAAPVYSRHTDQTAHRTPLSAAAEAGSATAVGMLLRRGVAAQPDALRFAAALGHAEVVAALLPALLDSSGADASGGADGSHGDDVDAVEAAVCAALSVAAEGGHAAAIAELCANAAARAAAARGGGDALHAACALHGDDAPAHGEGRGCREAIVASLCDAGVPTSLTNARGDAPLHVAASRGLSGVATLLLDAGTDAAQPNSRGERPVDLARGAGHEALAASLAQAGGTAVLSALPAGLGAAPNGAKRLPTLTALPGIPTGSGALPGAKALPPLTSPSKLRPGSPTGSSPLRPRELQLDDEQANGNGHGAANNGGAPTALAPIIRPN